MNEETLERVYQENLEEQIIAYLAKICDFSYEKAMDLYYGSKLADKIYLGKEGIHYWDEKVRAQLVLETEKELLD